MADEVVVERHDGWAELILNRPATRNAIDGPLGMRLAEHARALGASTDASPFSTQSRSC